MAANYQELSAMFQKELEKRQELAKACTGVVTQFAQGFVDEFHWPADQIDFLPLEGSLKALPKGIGVQNGPGEALRFTKGIFDVGLAVQINSSMADRPDSPDPVPGGRFIRVRTPIVMRAEGLHILMKVGDEEHKVDPANAAADLRPVYESYFRNMSEFLENLGEGHKPNHFGFHVDN